MTALWLSRTMADRKRAEKAGRSAETLAALYLRLKGYKIVHARYKTPVGEIDIIARRHATLVFVEVKRRTRASEQGTALEGVNTRRIVRAAEWFMSAHPRFGGYDCRFDVIFLAPRRWPYHLINAFGAT